MTVWEEVEKLVQEEGESVYRSRICLHAGKDECGQGVLSVIVICVLMLIKKKICGYRTIAMEKIIITLITT